MAEEKQIKSNGGHKMNIDINFVKSQICLISEYNSRHSKYVFVIIKSQNENEIFFQLLKQCNIKWGNGRKLNEFNPINNHNKIAYTLQYNNTLKNISLYFSYDPKHINNNNNLSLQQFYNPKIRRN